MSSVDYGYEGAAMSTIVIAKYRADPSRFEKLVKSNDVDFTAVARARMSKGCISHRYAVGDGAVYVIDEWPSVEAYNQGWETSRGGRTRLPLKLVSRTHQRSHTSTWSLIPAHSIAIRAEPRSS